MRNMQVGRQRRAMAGEMLVGTASRRGTARPAFVAGSWHVSLIPAMPAPGAGHKAYPADGTRWPKESST